MKEKVIESIVKLSIKYQKIRCFSEMERVGVAAFGCCSGIVGGDSSSNYLAYQCMDCPYFVAVN